jgi:hypothetical protein
MNNNNNNTLNEISTNESLTQSPSKNKKEIESKSFIPKFSSFNKSLTNKLFFQKENINLSNLKKRKIVSLNSKTKRKRRIFKKIIKKKPKLLLLDFDYILKDIIGQQNLEKNTFKIENNPIQKLLNKNKIDLKNDGQKNSNNNDKDMMKNKCLINKNKDICYMNNICSSSFQINEKNSNIFFPTFNELSDSFFEDNSIEVSFPHLLKFIYIG